MALTQHFFYGDSVVSTELYKRVVLFVHGLCTKSTKPLYKKYMGVVQKLYKYHRVVFYSLWANKANLPYLFQYLSGEPFYLTKQT